MATMFPSVQPTFKESPLSVVIFLSPGSLNLDVNYTESLLTKFDLLLT